MHFCNSHRIFTIAFLIVAVSAITVSSIQEAWSMPGPTRIWLPEVNLGGTQSVDIIGLANFVPHTGSIWIAEPTVIVTFPVSPVVGVFPIPCVVTFGGPAAARVWQLTDTGVGGDPAALWRITGVGDTMNFKISPFSGGAGGAGGGGSPTVGAPTMLGAPPYAWNLIRGTGSPLTGLPATASVHALLASGWNIILCGYDKDTDTPPLEFTDSFQYKVIKPVGGEILPINTTSLLLAGFSSNPFWILTMLAITAGAAFTLLRFQLLRK